MTALAYDTRVEILTTFALHDTIGSWELLAAMVRSPYYNIIRVLSYCCNGDAVIYGVCNHCSLLAAADASEDIDTLLTVRHKSKEEKVKRVYHWYTFTLCPLL